MLLEFRVKNYRSFRDEAVLSMVASSDEARAETNLIETDVQGIPKALSVAAVYGANASGKSNLMRAFVQMSHLIVHSATFKPGDGFPDMSFRLSEETQEDPTEFEVSFVHAGMRYQYGFKLNKERILEEWLFAYKTLKPQRWFFRSYDNSVDKYNYIYSSHFKGEKQSWERQVKSNSLYLSVATSLNSSQLESVFLFFGWAEFFYNANDILKALTIKKINDGHKESVVNFLKTADISIDDVYLSSTETPLASGLAIASGEKKESMRPPYL